MHKKHHCTLCISIRMGSLKEHNSKVNAPQAGYAEQQSPKPAATLPYKAQGSEAMCQQRAQHILLPLASPLPVQRQDNSPLKEGKHWTVRLFALPIIEHLPQDVTAQLSSCLTILCPQRTLYSVKTLSCSKQENPNSHDTIHSPVTLHINSAHLNCLFRPWHNHLQVAGHGCVSFTSPVGLCIIISHLHGWTDGTSPSDSETLFEILRPPPVAQPWQVCTKENISLVY